MKRRNRAQETLYTYRRAGRSGLLGPAALVVVAVGVACGCGHVPTLIKPNVGNGAVAESTITRDGWSLSLFHYSPRGTRRKYPVILCPGLHCNNFFFHIGRPIGFARYLAENGYDVWSLSLRGTGYSTKPGIYTIREGVRVLMGGTQLLVPQPTFNPLQSDWHIDDFIKNDVPAAIKYVKKKTGAEKVNWVGHSLGGIVALCAMTTGDVQDDINSMVGMGTSLSLPLPPNAVAMGVIKNRLILALANSLLSTTAPATVGGVLGGHVESPLEWLFYNRSNMEDTVFVETLYRVTEDVPNGVLDQYIKFMKSGTLKSANGKIDYFELSKGVEVPCLLLAGKLDNAAPPEAVRDLYHRISSQDKKMVIVGKANAASAEYGHMDLVLGRNAVTEVYPLVLEWLNARN